MRRVLIAPLDWGLGHATRCIPVIREFIDRGCEVLIAGSGDSLSLLKAEFPSLKHFILPPYSPEYPVNGKFMAWKMALQLPKFFRVIRRERKIVERIIHEQQVDLLISDNRYGCRSSVVPSVFITHQSNILMPKRFGWLAHLVRKKNEKYIKHFTTCWLPDYSGDHSLAGALISHSENQDEISYVHIGPLSRFRYSQSTREQKFDTVVILSGPEPQRTMLEKILVPQLIHSGLRYFVVRGVFQQDVAGENHANFLTAEKLQEFIESAEVIIARSGYSTVMDMTALRKKVIFIPTPGQPEQEYLARRLMNLGVAFYMEQHDFELRVALEQSRKYLGFSSLSFENKLLAEAVDLILKQANGAEKVS
jgi:uncharacterized protein (TIGR00661 family)